jgi:ribose 5-phosphate isomerase A
MILGLGTGSTTSFYVKKIGELLADGLIKNIKGIPSSKRTEILAKDMGIPLTDFEEHPIIDICVDGADEVDEHLNLIKGGGGALLREKVLAQVSKEFIVIVDDSKTSQNLGEKWAVPVEVLKFAFQTEVKFLESLGAKVELRTDENRVPYLTDENNYILDANFGIIENPAALASKLEKRAGIIEHGLFINLATKVIIAGNDGIKILEKK